MIQEWDDAFKDFTIEELACPMTGGYKFHPGFAEKFQQLRNMFSKPIYPTSCCRSREYNESLRGSSPKSLHIYDEPSRGSLGTAAMDIRVIDSIDRHELLKIALALHFSCYFIGPTAIHLDQRIILGEPAIFWIKR